MVLKWSYTLKFDLPPHCLKVKKILKQRNTFLLLLHPQICINKSVLSDTLITSDCRCFEVLLLSKLWYLLLSAAEEACLKSHCQITVNNWFYLYLPWVPFFFLLPWSLQLCFVSHCLSFAASKTISNIRRTGDNHLISVPLANFIIVPWLPGHLKETRRSQSFCLLPLLFSRNHIAIHLLSPFCNGWVYKMSQTGINKLYWAGSFVILFIIYSNTL